MRTVVGVFERGEARRTIDDLKEIGVRERDISILSRDDEGHIQASGPVTGYLGEGADEPAMIAALTRVGLTDAEARRYLGGLGQGYTLEAAAVDDDKANEALDIMREHAGNIGGREARTTPQRLEGGGEQLFPVIVEELDIGKREVGAGGVRVASRTTEQPIEKEIELRQEKVDVERRKVDRPLQTGDQDLAFQDREIEVTATSEEPVVRKTARVVEEVAVTKDTDTRTETIRDTVRRTDVDVERIPFEPSRYRDDYERSHASSGGSFDEYEPAYRFGHELRADERYRDQDWTNAEPYARERWESKNPGTWDRFKAAVRHAWDKAKS